MRNLCQIYTCALFWVCGREIWIALHRPSLTTTGTAAYRIGNVSGFYGPGAWAASILTVASCRIDRLFGKTESDDGEASMFSGLDPSLLAAYAYPIIAAMDLLRRLRYHTWPDDLLKKLGSLAGAVTVVK